MSPIIPSRYGHPKYNIFPQKSRGASLGGYKTPLKATPGSDSKSRRKQRIEDSKITVQPAEDEEADNFFSKQLAAARFQRNHRLINTLFSDVIIEQEQANENDKLAACKKRVRSLTDYQKKLDEEMAELNEKFSAKKAKIAEESQKFTTKLNEFITNSKKEIENLRTAQEARRQQEATQRQQAAAKAALTPSENKSDSTPMDVDADPVDSVLNQLVQSIADAV